MGKPISLAYGLTQFKEYNPLIYRLLNPVVSLLPDSLQNRPIPFRIGEQLAVGDSPMNAGRHSVLTSIQPDR